MAESEVIASTENKSPIAYEAWLTKSKENKSTTRSKRWKTTNVNAMDQPPAAKRKLVNAALKAAAAK